LLVDDFAAMVNSYLQDPKKHILSDQASTNDVLQQIDAIQKTMHSLNSKSSPEQLESVNKDVTSLHNTIKEWLRLEAFIQRGFRAQYIVSYLGQVEAILSYASHRARALNNTLAGTDATFMPLHTQRMDKPVSTTSTSEVPGGSH
jgi:cytochrome P450